MYIITPETHVLMENKKTNILFWFELFKILLVVGHPWCTFIFIYNLRLLFMIHNHNYFFLLREVYLQNWPNFINNEKNQVYRYLTLMTDKWASLYQILFSANKMIIIFNTGSSFLSFWITYIHATTKDMLYTNHTYHIRRNYFTVTIIAQMQLLQNMDHPSLIEANWFRSTKNLAVALNC